MSYILVFFILFGVSAGQTYAIKILGLPAADVEQTIHESGRIEFKTQNRGIFDMIWPAKNFYEATFDSTTFALKSWHKKIRQGDFKQTIAAEIDSVGHLIYDKKNKIKIAQATHTIFTLLAMIQSKEPEELDTKWFNFEQEGLTGKARFVWADKANAWNGKDSVLCDHYRLDIKIKETSGKFLEQTDYFMEDILAEGVVRELWVSRKKQKKIIGATLKTAWFPVSAIINE